MWRTWSQLLIVRNIMKLFARFLIFRLPPCYCWAIVCLIFLSLGHITSEIVWQSMPTPTFTLLVFFQQLLHTGHFKYQEAPNRLRSFLYTLLHVRNLNFTCSYSLTNLRLRCVSYLLFFFISFGFHNFSLNPQSMFVPISSIRSLLPSLRWNDQLEPTKLSTTTCTQNLQPPTQPISMATW